MITVAKIKSSKSTAWNLIGGEQFLENGHLPIQKSQIALSLLLEGIQPDKQCCILGASAIPLVKEALKRNYKLSVLDFSKKMCSELKRNLPDKQCVIKLHDVINTPTSNLHLSMPYHYIITDQIMNCFSHRAIPKFFKNISAMLAPGGEVRAIIKIGFYEVDKMLLATGRKKGTVNKFYNVINHTINYAKASAELKEIAGLYKNLPKETFLNWFKGRGEEMRFQIPDLTTAFFNAQITQGKFKIEKIVPLADLKGFVFCQLRWFK